jgi:hypothetical protein
MTHELAARIVNSVPLLTVALVTPGMGTEPRGPGRIP